MRLPHVDLVRWFADIVTERTVSHSYVLVSPDTIALERTARAVLQTVDGVHRTQYADALVVDTTDPSLGIDEVRVLREHLSAFPAVAPYRTALVLGAERLTTEAQNALLKITEEPPSSAVILLAVADEETLLPTLRSRVQRILLAPLTTEEVATWLIEQGQPDAEAARIAALSHGSLSQAQELLLPSPARVYAQKLIAAPVSQIAALTKAAAGDELSLPDLLRALSAELAYTASTARTRELWHRVQRLRFQPSVRSLSLRLQINALFTDLPL